MPEKVASVAKEGVSSWRETTRTERIDWTAIERHAKMEGTNGIVFRMAGKGGNSETVRICVFFCERMKRPSNKQCVILTRDPRGGKEKEGRSRNLSDFVPLRLSDENAVIPADLNDIEEKANEMKRIEPRELNSR